MLKSLTASQLHDLETTERIASCFSLLGTSFIFFTFTYSSAFRRPVNRLIFYASWGNTLCNIATLMAQAGVRAGRDSHLCQFQSFLIQMFLPADALWNLAMAINVYLTIFRKYNAQQLKALEWRYHIMGYVLPFLLAFICTWISTAGRGRIYGPATLWCSIDIHWVVLRMALVYVPAWCCIAISFIIYLLAGRHIFIKRRELRAFSSPTGHIAPVENPFTDYKTTEIHITSELATLQSPVPTPLKTEFFSAGDELPRPQQVQSPNGYAPYSVTIGSSPMMSPRSEGPTVTTRARIERTRNRAANEANAAAFGYTKVALLFFVSLLVTWVPSSINRVYSVFHPDVVSLPFSYATGIVLPLMGFWNSVIYITTSWRAVSLLFRGKLQGELGKRPSLVIKRPSMGSRRVTGGDGDSIKALSPVLGDRGWAAKGYDQV